VPVKKELMQPVSGPRPIWIYSTYEKIMIKVGLCAFIERNIINSINSKLIIYLDPHSVNLHYSWINSIEWGPSTVW